MKKTIRFFSQEYVFVLFCSFFLMAISFAPTIYEAFQAGRLGDSRRVMLWGEHNYTYDYNVYLAKMRQGAEGRWTVINKYTSEPNSGVLLQEFYLISGKISHWLGLTPAMAYQIMRLILGFAFLLVIYQLIAYFLKNSWLRKVAFLLSAISAGFPGFGFWEGSWHPLIWFGWWQEVDVIKRATYVPHYLIGHIMTVLCLLFLLKSQKKLSILAGIIAGFVHPPSLLIVWGIWGFWTLFNFKLKNAIQGLIFVFITSLPLLYINQVTAVYPWKTLVDFTRSVTWAYSFKEYCLSLGMTLVLGTIAAVKIILQRQKNYLPLVFWLLVVPLGMVFFKLTKLFSDTYFMQVAIQIPLAILSTWLLVKIYPKFRNWVVLGILLISVPTWYASLSGQFQFIDQRVAAVMPLVPYPSQVMYPLKDWWEGIKWLESNTPRDAVVLSAVTAGNYIPAYAGNTVYFGHQSETVRFNEKKLMVDAFFAGTTKEKEAKEFLRQGRVDYVFYGPQEKELGKFAPPSFLTPVYQSESTTIYQVALGE